MKNCLNNLITLFKFFFFTLQTKWFFSNKLTFVIFCNKRAVTLFQLLLIVSIVVIHELNHKKGSWTHVTWYWAKNIQFKINFCNACKYMYIEMRNSDLLLERNSWVGYLVNLVLCLICTFRSVDLRKKRQNYNEN